MSQQQQIIREQAAQVEYLVFDANAEPRIQSAAGVVVAATPAPVVVSTPQPVQQVVQQVVQEQPQYVAEEVQYVEQPELIQEAPIQYIEQVAEPQYVTEEVVAPVEAVQETVVVAEGGCGQQEAVVVAEPVQVVASPAPCVAATPAPCVATPAPCAAATPVQVIATPAPCANADLIAQAEAHFASSACASLADLPPLPPVNKCCWAPPPVAPGVTTCQKVQLPTEEKVVETNDCDVQTVIRENNNYTTYNQTQLLTVNRNHHHKQQIVENQLEANTYVTNNVVKVNDIHRQQVEVVQGAKRVRNDARDTVTVEPAKCFRSGVNGTPYPC